MVPVDLNEGTIGFEAHTSRGKLAPQAYHGAFEEHVTRPSWNATFKLAFMVPERFRPLPWEYRLCSTLK